MKYYVPLQTLSYDDIVILYIPKLREPVKEILGCLNRGEPGRQQSNWGLYTWPENSYGIALEVRHYDQAFTIVLPPAMWEVIPDIIHTRTIGVLTERRYWKPDGTVTALLLDRSNRLVQTLYKVYNVDRGFRGMLPELKALKERWNPDGVLTYLLQILGEALESDAR